MGFTALDWGALSTEQRALIGCLIGGGALLLLAFITCIVSYVHEKNRHMKDHKQGSITKSFGKKVKNGKDYLSTQSGRGPLYLPRPRAGGPYYYYQHGPAAGMQRPARYYPRDNLADCSFRKMTNPADSSYTGTGLSAGLSAGLSGYMGPSGMHTGNNDGRRFHSRSQDDMILTEPEYRDPDTLRLHHPAYRAPLRSLNVSTLPHQYGSYNPYQYNWPRDSYLMTPPPHQHAYNYYQPQQRYSLPRNFTGFDTGRDSDSQSEEGYQTTRPMKSFHTTLPGNSNNKLPQMHYIRNPTSSYVDLSRSSFPHPNSKLLSQR